ncbi:MAG: sodium:solute symporter [Oscillospiraceae bacterium]|nr:sodium:solute symporter [Oscillospiraceae bacterium]
MFIKVLLLAIFFGVTVAIGLYCRKHASDVNSFVLGGRSIGPWLTAFAYGTSYFSAVVFVGYAGQFGWRYGISATWIGLGNAFIGSLLAWVVLGRRTRVMTRHLNSATMPEFFGARYGSQGLKVVSSAIIFIFLIPYTASLYNGLSRLFAMAFDVDFWVCIVIMALLTGVYVIVGGYVATAVNDFVQGVIMLAGIIAVIFAVLNANGGLMGSLEKLAFVEDAAVSSTPGIFASFFGPDPLNMLGVVILTSLGTWGLPQMLQKFYAIKSEKAVHKGTVISTVFALVIAGGCYFLGGFGRLFADKIEVRADGSVIFDSIIPTMMSGFSDLLIGVVVMLVLAASMSTLSALVMASASTLTLDFLKGNVIKKMDDKKQLFIIRSLIVVFVVISAAIAVLQYNKNVVFIAQLMGVSWGALAGSFLAPFLFGLYWKRTSKFAVWCGMGFGTLFMTANFLTNVNILPAALFPVILRSPVNAGAFAMLAGMLIVPVVSLLSQAPDKKLIDDCFSCYDEKVTVALKESLGD